MGEKSQFVHALGGFLLKTGAFYTSIPVKRKSYFLNSFLYCFYIYTAFGILFGIYTRNRNDFWLLVWDAYGRLPIIYWEKTGGERYDIWDLGKTMLLLM